MATHPLDVLRHLRRALASFEPRRAWRESLITATWNFETTIEEDELDGGYVVHSPQMRGCWSQGETIAEAKANFADAAEVWLEGRLEDTVDTAPTIEPRVHLRIA